MRITLTERFQADVRRLSPVDRAAVLDALLALPRVLVDPHSHSGVGLRKLHRSGIFEIRAGLGLRLIFGFEEDAAKFVLAGTHDEVKRFLRTL